MFNKTGKGVIMSQDDEMTENLDLQKFLSNNKPAHSASKLEPFKKDILLLKEQKFSDRQICENLLISKGISISQQGLNRFIHSRLNAEKTNQPKATAKPKQRQVSVPKIDTAISVSSVAVEKKDNKSTGKTKPHDFKIDRVPLEELMK